MGRPFLKRGLAAALVLGLMAPVAKAETLTDALIAAYKHSNLLEQNRALLRVADEDVLQGLALAEGSDDEVVAHRKEGGLGEVGKMYYFLGEPYKFTTGVGEVLLDNNAIDEDPDDEDQQQKRKSRWRWKL